MNGNLLDVPHGRGANVERVGGPAIERVDQITGVLLAMILTGNKHAQHFSAHIHLKDFAGSTVAAEQILGGTARDAKRPRGTHAGNGFLKVQVIVIDLDAPVSAVRDVNVVLAVRGDAMRSGELILIVTPGSHFLQPMPVRRNLDDTRV